MRWNVAGVASMHNTGLSHSPPSPSPSRRAPPFQRIQTVRWRGVYIGERLQAAGRLALRFPWPATEKTRNRSTRAWQLATPLI